MLHPTGRPFTTVYRVLRGPRFPYHVAVLAGIWPTFLLANSSMILCRTIHLILYQLFKLFLSKSVLHCPFCFFNLFLYHCSLRKTKNPRVLILGSLKFAVYVLLYTTSSRTLRISGARSYDRPLITDQQEAIKPACFGIVLK